MTFENIGQTARALAPSEHSAVGDQRGKNGVAETRRTSSEIVGWLNRRNPAETDKALVSLALSRGVNLEIEYQGRYPSGPSGERLPSYTVAVGCKAHGSDEDRKALAEKLRGAMTPADIPQIERWLAELSVLTAGRGVDGLNAEILVTAYSSRLAQYPADVARHALIGKSWKWFPSWQELEQVCDAAVGPRAHMIAALNRPAPEPEREYRPPTQEEKDRVAKLIEETFPNAPRRWRDRAAKEVTKGNCIEKGAA